MAPALAAKDEVSWQQLVQVGCCYVVQQPAGGVCGVAGGLPHVRDGIVAEGKVVDPGHEVAAVQACRWAAIARNLQGSTAVEPIWGLALLS